MSPPAGSGENIAARLGAGVVGVVLGQFAGSQAETIARILLFAKHGSERPTAHSVVELTLLLVATFTLCAAAFGWWSAKRGWTKYENVVVTVCVAVVVVSLSMVKHYLPAPNSHAPYRYSLASLLYYSIWFVILIVSPLIFMPSRSGGVEEKSKDRAQVAGVACAAALVGALAGTAMRLLQEEILGRSVIEPQVPRIGGLEPWQQSMWIVQPGTIGAVGGAFLTVALLPMWFPALWQAGRRSRAKWIGAYTFVSVAWAGVYGYWHYALRAGSWGESMISRELAEPWQFTLGFAILPLLLLTSFGLAFAAYRSKVAIAMLHAWPVRRRFWPGFATFSALVFGLGLTAIFGPVMAADGASARQIAFFALCHALNGFLVALSLRLSSKTMTWMDAPRRAEA